MSLSLELSKVFVQAETITFGCFCVGFWPDLSQMGSNLYKVFTSDEMQNNAPHIWLFSISMKN